MWLRWRRWSLSGLSSTWWVASPQQRSRRPRSQRDGPLSPPSAWRLDAGTGAAALRPPLISPVRPKMTQPKTKLRASPRPLPQGSFPTARRDVDARAVAARVARESYGKLVAYLAAASRDVPGAEDALADAFASALAVWPNQGAPSNPEGWLAKAARRRLIDAARRRRTADQASEALELIGSELKGAAGGPGGV